MKNLLLFVAVLCCLQLSASAQNQKAVDGEAPITLTQTEIKKTEAHFISENILADIKNRTAIISNSEELKAALKTVFGKDANITAVNVVAYFLKISNDENLSLSIRREALKVLYGHIPAGHKLETQISK